RAREVGERSRVYEIKMQFYIQQHRMHEALEVGLTALKLLEVELVQEPPPVVEVDLDRQMTDEVQLTKMRILMQLCAPSYVIDSTLNARVGWTMVHLAYAHGNSPVAAFAYGLLSVYFAGAHQIAESTVMGQLCLATAERYPSPVLVAKCAGLYYAHCMVWTRHLAESIAPLGRAVGVGLENGEIEWAGYCTFYYCDAMFFTGTPLPSLCATQDEHFEALCRRKQPLQATYLTLWRRLAQKLRKGSSNVPDRFDIYGRMWTDESLKEESIQSNNHMYAFTAFVAGCIGCWFERDFEGAVRAARDGVVHAGGCWGMMTNAQHNFYYSLSLTQLLRDLPPDHPDRADHLTTIESNQRLLHFWATHAPMNYGHKAHLIDAQLARLRGDHITAFKLYERSAQKAREFSYLHEEAMAWELAAEMASDLELKCVSVAFAGKAYAGYQRWGCRPKIKQMEAKYGKLVGGVGGGGGVGSASTAGAAVAGSSSALGSASSILFGSSAGLGLHDGVLGASSAGGAAAAASSSSTSRGQPPTSSTTSASAPATPAAELDMITLLRASQAISGEIQVSRLLEQLMKLLMETAGATTCLFVAFENTSGESDGGDSDGAGGGTVTNEGGGKSTDRLVLAAKGNDGKVTLLGNLPAEAHMDQAPLSVLLYVQRTGKQLILNDIGKDYRFNNDPYIIHRSPKSLLCTPIIFQNRVNGLLYLENDLTPNAFTTSSHARTLSILSAQAAISLANAQFCEQLQRNSAALAERNRELKSMNDRLVAEMGERKKTEEELVISKERRGVAEAEIVSKTMLLANTSHEIRTPMNGILGMLRFLLDTDLSPDQQEYVETIRVSANALLNLINDIVDLSKLEAHELVLERIEFDLVETMDDALDILVGQAHAKGLEMVAFVDPRVPVQLVGDPKRIRQIIINLANNGLKFTKNGHIIVNVKFLEMDAANVRIRFEVIDSGIGIEDKHLSKLFRPFSQVDASTTRLYGGSGLGLAICKKLVQIMEGDIRVTSRLSSGGQGSTFWVEIPFPIAIPAPPNPDAEAIRGKLVLVIMPDNLHFQSLKNRLHLCEVNVVHAINSDEALQILDESHRTGNTIHCILMDSAFIGVASASITSPLLPRQGHGLSLSPLREQSSVDELPRVSPPMDSTSPSLDEHIRANPLNIHIPIILLILKSKRYLTSTIVGSRGFADVLTVPVKRLRAIASLAAAMTSKPVRVGSKGSLFDKVPFELSLSSLPPKRDAESGAEDKGGSKKKKVGPWPGAEKIHLLLAEDNPINQRVAVPMLKRLGFNVDVVEDGRQAFQAVHSKTYDMILMDCQMPEMSGYEATGVIRQWYESKGVNRNDQVPIIAMTANAMADDRRKCLDCGMDDYISKPIDSTQLHSVLGKWMAIALERQDAAIAGAAEASSARSLRRSFEGMVVDDGQQFSPT
ncbi:hypothetical protein HK104_002566, partial [Borealophlyctis nickersoniae]